MSNRFCWGAFLCLLLSFAHATENVYEVALVGKTPYQRDQLAQRAHLDYVDFESGVVVTIVNEHDLIVLERELPHLIIDAMPLFLTTPQLESPNYVEFPRGDEAYHTVQEVHDKLKSLADTYPEASLISIGKSVEGRELLGLHMGTPGKPGIFFVGTHHAREHLSTEVPLAFAEKFLNTPEGRKWLNSRDIYIVPLLNPDGAHYDILSTRYRYWRKNRQPNDNSSYGVDLNRNYDQRWASGGSSRNPRSDVYHGPAPFSEPETKAVRDFLIAKENISIVVSFHTYSELILYPWGGSADEVEGEDLEIFKTMAAEMADMNGYRDMKSSDLYIATGDTCDWAYAQLKKYCFTFELTPSSIFLGGFYPGSSVIESTINDNWGPALYLTKHAENHAKF